MKASVPSVGRAIPLEYEWPPVICCLWPLASRASPAPVFTSPMFLAKSGYLVGTSTHNHLETGGDSLAHEEEELEKPECSFGEGALQTGCPVAAEPS